MTQPILTTIAFTGTDEHWQLLHRLEQSLNWPVANFITLSMVKYYYSLVPEKCKPETTFLSSEGQVFGYAYTGHQEDAFDETLLDSSLSFPPQNKYLPLAQQHLQQQIATARSMPKVTTLRAWLDNGSDFYTDLYTSNGFETSIVEPVSILELSSFDASKFDSYIDRFHKSSLSITTLKQLQQTHQDWEQKLYALWQTLYADVPNDTETNIDLQTWRQFVLKPWLDPEDFYIAVDGERWVGLTSYDRSDAATDVVATDLTAVLPEYRRQGVCTALKVFALKELAQKGFNKVFTDNEQDNPMLQLNLRLGFKIISSQVGCKLTL